MCNPFSIWVYDMCRSQRLHLGENQFCQDVFLSNGKEGTLLGVELFFKLRFATILFFKAFMPPLPENIALFLKSKPQVSVDLFIHFYETYLSLGSQEVETTKTTIAFGAAKRYCYIYQFSKKFVSGVFHLPSFHDEPTLFFKTGAVSATRFSHHFRLYSKEDVSPELVKYMKMAMEIE